MAKYRFDEIAINSIEKKKPVEDDRLSYIGLEHLDSDSLKVTRYGADVAPVGEKLVMKAGDVLFGKRRAYQKKVAIAPFDGIFSAHGMVLRPKENVIDKDFFPMFISSDYFLDAAINISVGSLSPTINWRDLRELEFDLPNLDEQRKLAKVLWAINDTVEAYKRLISATEELVKSQFIEMFGDIDRANYVKMEDVCTLITDGTHQPPKSEKDGIPFLFVSNITSNELTYDAEKFISEATYMELIKRTPIETGDILLSTVGSYGHAAIVKSDRKFCFQRHIAFLKPDRDKIRSGFLHAVILSNDVQGQIEVKVRGVAQKTLNLSEIKTLVLPLPDLQRQDTFLELVEQTDKSKFEAWKRGLQSYKIGCIIYENRLKGGGVMAAAVYVDVQPAVLDWVIQKTQFENVSSSVAESLAQWRNGAKKPTFHQLEDMSRKTHIPFGYFFLHTPPKDDFGLVEYRTVDSEVLMHPSRNLIDTVSAMQRVQDWMEDYSKENEFDPLPFVGRFSSGGDVKTIAEDIRKELELDIDWFKGRKDAHTSFQFLRERIAESGVMVMRNGIVGNNTRRKLNVNEFRAFTLVNEYAPLIFINSNDSENGRLFSLLHELAHVWIGRDSLYNEPYGGNEKVNQLEQLCNAVAAEILVPGELFLEKWRSLNGEIGQKVEQLSKKYFTCSRFVIALKAFDNGFINQEALNRMIAVLRKSYQNWSESEKNHKGGGGDYYLNFGARWDNRFIRALVESTTSGETLYTEAYRLTGTHGKTFDNLVKEVRGE